MVAAYSADAGAVAPQGDAPLRVPVRKLIAATGLACLTALILTHAERDAIANTAALGVVAGQALWNAAQVGLLFVLLCLWRERQRWWVVGLLFGTLACLPFAIYALSPGAWALGAILLVTCAAAWIVSAPDLNVAIVDAPARERPMLGKFELLAFTCTLLSSMYNYNASKICWPYWASIFAGVAAAAGFTLDPGAVAQGMYTVGLEGVSPPPYVPTSRGADTNGLGALIFALIWTVLPFLYILLFAACAMQARNSPGERVQQALCAFAIFHFLFLTDLVAYQFGRGIPNPAAEWCHWSERWVWRLAILLPIYQKLTSGQWLRGNGKVGVVMHYGLAAWATGFFVYQLVIYDAPRFYAFVVGEEPVYHELFGLAYRQELGYHGALVLMTVVYGFMVAAMRCKRIVAVPAPRASESGAPRALIPAKAP